MTVAGNGMLGVPGIAARTFAALHAQGISVSLSRRRRREQSICFGVPERRGAAARGAARGVRDEIARGEIDGIDVEPDLATVAVVGLGMAGTGHRGAGLRRAGRRAHQHRRDRAGLLGAEHLVRRRGEGRGGGAARGPRGVPAGHDRRRRGARAAARATSCCSASARSDARSRGIIAAQRERRRTQLRWWRSIDRSGCVFDPGLVARAGWRRCRREGGGRSAGAAPGRRGARRRTRRSTPSPQHALSRPILVDVTADDTSPLLDAALERGHGPRAREQAAARRAARRRTTRCSARPPQRGRRMLHEATVGAGLPILDTLPKLRRAGDHVLTSRAAPRGRSASCSPSWGAGARSARRCATRWQAATRSPIRATTSRAGRGAQGGDPRAAARFRGRARRRRGRVARAAALRALPLRRRSSRGWTSWTRLGQARASPRRRSGASAALRRHRDARRRPRRPRAVEPASPFAASRAPTTSSPSRPPLPEEPAGDHRPRRRPGRHRGRRAERHARPGLIRPSKHRERAQDHRQNARGAFGNAGIWASRSTGFS